MNVLTEAEARTKWCPFDRWSVDDEFSYGFRQRCKASECAAWRWESFASRDNPTREPGAGHSFDTTRGYCGLAGQP